MRLKKARVVCEILQAIGKAESMWNVVLACTTAFAVMLPQSLHAQANTYQRKNDLATSLKFIGNTIATRRDDKRAYTLIGSGFLRPLSSGEPSLFIKEWLEAHPKAVIVPVSRMIMTNTRNHMQSELVYIWIKDETNILNIDLVRAGIFAGGAMFDMVDNQNGLDQMMKDDPQLAAARKSIEKERAAAPQDRTDRLLPETDYKAGVAGIVEAQYSARLHKLGVWSDAMKEEREAAGIE